MNAPIASPAAIPDFVCTPRSARLRVEQCRLMHTDAEAGANAPAGSVARIRNAVCRGCAVGDAHDRGQLPGAWPDGTPVVRLELARHVEAPRAVPAALVVPGVTPVPRQARKAGARPRRAAEVAQSGDRDDNPENVSETAATPRETEESMSKRLITHNGITDTYAGWSKRTGLSAKTIAQRIRRGMSVAEALETAPASPSQAGAMGGRPKPAEASRRPRKAPARTKAEKAAPVPAPQPQSIGRDAFVDALLATARAAGRFAAEYGRGPQGRLVVIGDPNTAEQG